MQSRGIKRRKLRASRDGWYSTPGVWNDRGVPLQLISADSHVVEPADLWTSRLAPRWKDRTPRVEVRSDDQPGAYFLCEDVPPFGIGAFSAADVDPEKLPAHFRTGYEGVRPGGWDPVVRLRDQELDGVVAEVIYPSLALQLFRIRDGEFQTVTFQAYNDWLAEYCAGAPERLAGVAMVPLHDVATGIQELQRAQRLGLRGALIWSSAPDDRPYQDPVYEPFWAAAEEADLPLSLHLGTGAVPLAGTGGLMPISYMLTHLAVQRSIAQMIFGGVFERHPRLRIVSVENDIGWIPHYLGRLDHAGRKYGAFAPTKLRTKPSETFRRHVAATFQEDPLGVELRDDIGVECLLWASDYPHSDSTWPHSRDVVARDFAGVPEDELRRMVFDNTARVYGFRAATA
jgi:predicted TIM-barrel fold metal-dependent hydrolase